MANTLHGILSAASHSTSRLQRAGNVFESGNLQQWQRTLHVDFRAALVGAHLAVAAMARNPGGGAIVSVASAAGVFAMPMAPVYSAAKAGLVHFTRSAAKPLAARGITVAAVCPQFVDTEFVPDDMRKFVMSRYGSLLSTQTVAAEIIQMCGDPDAAGRVRVLLQNGKAFNWEPRFSEQAQQAMAASPQARAPPGADSAQPQSREQQRHSHRAPSAPSSLPPLPASYRRWEVRRLSHKFADAVELATVSTPGSVPEGHVLVRRVAAGVNASDVNFTSGAYHGSRKAAQAALPFAAGFESVGVVQRCGAGCSALPRPCLIRSNPQVMQACASPAALARGQIQGHDASPPTPVRSIAAAALCAEAATLTAQTRLRSEVTVLRRMQSCSPARRWRR